MLQTPVSLRQKQPGSQLRTTPWITIQDLWSWTYLYPVRGLSHLLPVPVLIWLADRLGPVYARLRRSRVRWIGDQVTRVFAGRELPADPADMAREHLARDLRKSIEDLALRRIDSETLKSRATLRGTEHLDAALAHGQGAIVISGHFHANRLGKYYLRRMGYSIMSIRNRHPANGASGRFGQRYLVPAYGRFLDRIVEDEIHVQESGRGTRMLQRLRENGLVNVHIDSAISSEWYWVPFLNGERPFAGGFIRIAEMTGAPLLPMQCLGDTSGFEIVFGEPVFFQGRSSSAEFTYRLMIMVKRLESWVLEHPTQWELWTRLAERPEAEQETMA